MLAVCGFALSLASATAFASEYQLRSLNVDSPYARATPPGAMTAGAFMKIANRGNLPDRLVRAASPAAGGVELHEMKMEGSVMRMRSVVGIEIGAGETVALRPGGYHLMLVNLKHPLGEGEDVPLTLTFEKAGSLDVVVKVEAMGASAPTR